MVVHKTYHCNNQILEWEWASDNELMPYPYYTSCYLVDGLLIDSGAPGGESDLREFVKSLNHDQIIEKCFITHTHEDHAGGAHMLSNEFDIPIYTSKKAIAILKKGKTYPEYRQAAWGPELLPVNAIMIDKPIITNSKKYKFELFPMRGHAPELVALIEKRQQWAFVADAVQPKYKMIFGKNSDIQEDISIIYQSLSNLYDFTEGMDQLLIFSAGNGVLQGREILIKKMEEIEDLWVKVHDYNDKFQKEGFSGKKIMKKIVKNLFARESILGQLTQGDLSRENLIISLLKWEKNDN
ncbi:MAG: MBL fold metallo-hydrolase [Promethearchaeota archaeon]|nr:MAG: MBL fold metallo-hydrolase [Candidatus Lokiarchaeota archaeon]